MGHREPHSGSYELYSDQGTPPMGVTRTPSCCLVDLKSTQTQETDDTEGLGAPTQL